MCTNRWCRKFMAWVLIIALVAPFGAEAQVLNLQGDIQIGAGAAQYNEQLLKAVPSGQGVQITNFDNQAPSVQNSSVVGNRWTRTTQTPAVTLTGRMKEGIFDVRATHYTEDSGVVTLKHDATPPRCPPAPTTAAYETGADYYAENGLKNPWPQGLNGEWTNQEITFNNNNPRLCRDQIGVSRGGGDACLAAGGERVSAGGRMICQFDRASCPANWSRYQNWTATTSDTCYGYPSNFDGCGSVSCTAAGHSWSNRAPRTCTESRTVSVARCDSGGEMTCTARATVTSVGCLPTGMSSLPAINETRDLFVSRHPQVEAAVCAAADGDSLFFYHEDLQDCRRKQAGNTPTLTLPASQMSGCAAASSNGQTTIAEHDRVESFVMSDLAENNSAACLTPPAKYDAALPVIGERGPEGNELSQGFGIEHEGLELPLEFLRVTGAQAARYRADDGPVYLHVALSDPDDVPNHGHSGLNWEPIAETQRERDLEVRILEQEQVLQGHRNEVEQHEAEVVLTRAAILRHSASLLNELAVNNLWNRVSQNLTRLETNSWAASIKNLHERAVSASAPNFNVALFNEAVSLLQSPKFADFNGDGRVDEADEVLKEAYADDLGAANPNGITVNYTNYTTSLQAVAAEALGQTLGRNAVLAPVENLFTNYYSQWQVDKRKNYSNFQANWLTVLSNINNAVTTSRANFVEKRASLAENVTFEMASRLDGLPDGRTVDGYLSEIANSTQQHAGALEQTLGAVEAANAAVSSFKTYLQNFDPNTDVFDGLQVSAVVGAVNEAQNAVLTLKAQVHSSDGVLGIPVASLAYALKNPSSGVLQIIAGRDSSVRGLRDEILNTQTNLAQKETILATHEDSLETAEAVLSNLRVQLAQARTNRLSRSDSVNSFAEDKITHLQIERLGAGAKVEQFFPPSTTPLTGNRFKWNLNLYKFEDENQPIFAVAGDYKITLRAYDKAANLAEKHGFVKILPATLEVDLQSNCASASRGHYADNQDTCSIWLPQTDRFGNLVAANQNLTLKALSQNVDGSYNLIESKGTNYVNGLRFVDGTFSGTKHVFSWQPANAPQKNIGLKSLLPTIVVRPYEPNPSYAFGAESENGFMTNFALEYPSINRRGDVVEGEINEEVENLAVKFKPWLNVTLSDISGAPSGNMRITPGESFPIFMQAGTGSTAKKLPANFALRLVGFVHSAFTFNNQNLALPGVAKQFRGVDAWAVETNGVGMPSNPETTINRLQPGGTLSPAFYPVGAYKMSDSPREDKVVYVPGVPLGACTDGTLDCLEDPILVGDVPTPENPDDDSCDSGDCGRVGPPLGRGITVESAQATEGHPLRFEVALSSPAAEETEVFFRVEDQTTEAGKDYPAQPLAGLVFAEGETRAQLILSTTEDQERETVETLQVVTESFAPAGAIVNMANAQGTINDDDNELTIEASASTEGAACGVVVSLARPLEQDLEIEVSPGATGDVAEGGVDYVTGAVTGTIVAGESSVLLNIETLEDAQAEETEAFTTTITSIRGAEFPSLEYESFCNIEDDDVQADVSILAREIVLEGDRMLVDVVLSEAENEEIVLELETYNLEAENETARSGTSCDDATADYVGTTFSVRIPAGSLGGQMEAPGIETCVDERDESLEDFGIRVKSVQEGTLGDTSGVGIGTIRSRISDIDRDVMLISRIEGVESNPQDQVQFKVTISENNGSGVPIVLKYELIDGTATGGLDYDNSDVLVTIPEGANSGLSTPITIYDDQLVETEENFVFRFKSLESGNMDDVSLEGVGFITDNDIAPRSVYVNNSSAEESALEMEFPVVLSRKHIDNSGAPLVLSFETVEGSAVAGDDYVHGDDYEVSIPHGSNSGVLVVDLIDDDRAELLENFRVRFKEVLSDHEVGNTDEAVAVGEILDDDEEAPLPVLKISASTLTVEEGGTGVFEVELDRAPRENVRVTFVPFSEEGEATRGEDYKGETKQVVFTAGSYRKEVRIKTIDDNEEEKNELFSLRGVPADASQFLSASDTGEMLIEDNDEEEPPVELPNLIIEDADPVMEGDFALFNVRVDRETEEEIVVTLGTVNGTAESGSDYEGESGLRLVIPAGSGPSDLIPVLTREGEGILTNADNENEGEEVFVLRHLSTVSGNLNNSGVTAIAAIINRDVVYPTVVINDGEGKEGGQIHFEVSLSTPNHDGVTLSFTGLDDSATSPADYNCPEQETTLIFAAGARGPQTVSCDLVLDQVNEGLETFSLGVDSFEGRLAERTEDVSAVGLIENDQFVDVRVLSPEVVIENVEGGAIEFAVKLYDGEALLTNALERTLNLTLTPTDITAIGGANFDLPEVDFLSTPINLVLSPGRGLNSTFQRVSVPINNDAVVEYNDDAPAFPEHRQEAFLLDPVSQSFGIRNTQAGTGTIQDEDYFTCSDDAEVHIRDAHAVEGEDMNFNISLDRNLCGNVRLTLRAVPDTAEASDFASQTLEHTVDIRRYSRTPSDGFSIPTVQDTLVEGTEKFYLEFVSAEPSHRVNRVERKFVRENGTLQDMGTVPVWAVITDNDVTVPPTIKPDLIIADSNATEGAGLKFAVSLSKPNPDSKTDIVFSVSSDGLTDGATVAVDYEPVVAMVSIAAGTTVGMATVLTVDDDLIEGDEHLRLSYASLADGILNSTADTGEGIIVDNDEDSSLKPLVVIASSSAQEGNNVEFGLSLKHPNTGADFEAPAGGITFDLEFRGGNNPGQAMPTNDFDASPKTVTVEANGTGVNFAVATEADDIAEGLETFAVHISGTNKPDFVNNLNGVNATGTIVDSDVLMSDPCVANPSMCLTTSAGEPGISIEGQIITDKSLCAEDDTNEATCGEINAKTITLGTSTAATDIREEITQNAYRLVRGLQQANVVNVNNSTLKDTSVGGSKRWDIYTDNLEDGGITYLKGTLNANGEPMNTFRIGVDSNGLLGDINAPRGAVKVRGRHTIIIEDANLNIVGDMAYETLDSSLGVILLNTNNNASQTAVTGNGKLNSVGQLTIFSGVRHIVGAYFADGSLVSNLSTEGGYGAGRLVQASDGDTTNDWEEVNGQLGRQLILTGNLLTRNTWGGSEKTPPEDPWGRALGLSDLDLARMYDLDYVRRYVPEYEANSSINETSASKSRCSRLPTQPVNECYVNKKSFIIRLDPRLQENPPPGFEATESIRFR